VIKNSLKGKLDKPKKTHLKATRPSSHQKCGLHPSKGKSGMATAGLKMKYTGIISTQYIQSMSQRCLISNDKKSRGNDNLINTPGRAAFS
jgi:hypothetical protein